MIPDNPLDITHTTYGNIPADYTPRIFHLQYWVSVHKHLCWYPNTTLHSFSLQSPWWYHQPKQYRSVDYRHPSQHHRYPSDEPIPLEVCVSIRLSKSQHLFSLSYLSIKDIYRLIHRYRNEEGSVRRIPMLESEWKCTEQHAQSFCDEDPNDRT